MLVRQVEAVAQKIDLVRGDGGAGLVAARQQREGRQPVPHGLQVGRPRVEVGAGPHEGPERVQRPEVEGQFVVGIHEHAANVVADGGGPAGERAGEEAADVVVVGE